VIAPTVHLNGTDGETLRVQLETAARAVQKALDAVYAAAPNARDYPLTAAYDIARATNSRHLRALVTVRDDLATSWEHVQEQIDARSASPRRVAQDDAPLFAERQAFVEAQNDAAGDAHEDDIAAAANNFDDGGVS
jgi:hypothetical protein